MKNIIEKLKYRLLKILRGTRKFIFPGITLLCFAFSVGFAEKEYKSLTCNKIVINIPSEKGHRFLLENDVDHLLKIHSSPPLIGRKFREINLSELEKVLERNPFVKNTELFGDWQGRLFVRIEQRNPAMRVISLNGNDFYLDENGEKMPLSSQYTPRVILVRGHLETVNKVKASPPGSMLDKVFQVVQLIRKDRFMKAMTGEIYINKSEEMILVPRVGNQKILLGRVTDISKKIKKLKGFYRKVMPSGGWQKYRWINLKYDKQIIAK